MAVGLTLSPGCHIVIGVKHLPVCSDVAQTGRRDHIVGNTKSAFCVVDSRPDPRKGGGGGGPSGQKFRGRFREIVSGFTGSLWPTGPCPLFIQAPARGSGRLRVSVSQPSPRVGAHRTARVFIMNERRLLLTAGQSPTNTSRLIRTSPGSSCKSTDHRSASPPTPRPWRTMTRLSTTCSLT